jgi:hypothetical protein
MRSVCTMLGFNKQPTASFTDSALAVEIWHHGAWLPGVVLGRRLEDAHDCVTLVRIAMPDQAEVIWARQADLRIPSPQAPPGITGDPWPRRDGGATPGRHRACEYSLADGHPGEARTTRLPVRRMPVPAARRDLSALGPTGPQL